MGRGGHWTVGVLPAELRCIDSSCETAALMQVGRRNWSISCEFLRMIEFLVLVPLELLACIQLLLSESLSVVVMRLSSCWEGVQLTESPILILLRPVPTMRFI